MSNITSLLKEEHFCYDIIVISFSLLDFILLKCLVNLGGSLKVIGPHGTVQGRIVTDDRYLVFEITVTKTLVVSKIYLTG